MRVVTREQAVSYRLHVNHLTERLPAGSHEEAADVGLQDTAPRDALLGLHARVTGCEPSGWEHPSLIQTYSPRAAAYVLPRKDFGIFTLGRDRDGRFIAPGKRILTPAADTFHPNGVLVDGRIAGAWGRKGGKVDVILTEQLTPPQYDALATEAASFPIRGARLAASIGGAVGVI